VHELPAQRVVPAAPPPAAPPPPGAPPAPPRAAQGPDVVGLFPEPGTHQ
jgi:hypothetical protein